MPRKPETLIPRTEGTAPMSSIFCRRTDVIESETVETIKQLQDALGAMQGSGKGDRHLSDTYVVELVDHIMSDNSELREVRIRRAEKVV
jgi:hypothetical protein